MGTKFYISGNTYPVKGELRNLGCSWDAKRRAWFTDSEAIAAQARTLVSPMPLYNSPPPPDLGTSDPVALASAHGRRAKAGATVQSFTCYGLSRGDDGLPNGSIRIVDGVRYVQVARTERQYLSSEWLEDMDMFTTAPGGSYHWDGVAIEDTDTEARAA